MKRREKMKKDVLITVRGEQYFEGASPDETELWICHHCLKQSDPECVPMPRYCHCQRVFFDENDFPHLSLPVPTDTFYAPPSGE